MLEGGYRWYDQSAADFYSDLFPRRDFQNFLARDKELSTFTSHMLSLGATYELPSFGWSFLQRSTVNLFYDRIRFDYEDFRDVRAGGTPGRGLGLSIVHAIVTRWKGRIEVQSTLGQGSSFILSLPDPDAPPIPEDPR